MQILFRLSRNNKRYYNPVNGLFMIKSVMTGLIAGILALATLAATGTLNLAIVSAEKQCDDPPCDGWGQGTKETIQAEGGKAVGEHSSNPDPNDVDHDTPRKSLGNFAEDNTGNKNPSGLGDAEGGSLP
jgi:hypothetical protein